MSKSFKILQWSCEKRARPRCAVFRVSYLRSIDGNQASAAANTFDACWVRRGGAASSSYSASCCNRHCGAASVPALRMTEAESVFWRASERAGPPTPYRPGPACAAPRPAPLPMLRRPRAAAPPIKLRRASLTSPCDVSAQKMQSTTKIKREKTLECVCSCALSLDRLRNDLYCVEWDVKLYYTIPYHSLSRCKSTPTP